MTNTKTPESVLKSVSKYQKNNPEKCREKCRRYYQRLKEDPERYQALLRKRKEYAQRKKAEKNI